MPDIAYIDPGSGSLIIQAAIAAMVAVPLFFRSQIARLLRTVRGREPSTDTPGTVDDAERDG